MSRFCSPNGGAGDGPQQVKLIVTRLDSASATQMLNAYARRWSVEVCFKELKSGLHLGQMQVTREPERVVKALLLPLLAYLLLLRLYGKEIEPEKGYSLTALKNSGLSRKLSKNIWSVQTPAGAESSINCGPLPDPVGSPVTFQYNKCIRLAAKYRTKV